MEIISGEWGKTKIFALPFVTFGATDWLPGVVLALGDVKIAKDGGGYSDIPPGQLDVVSDHIVVTLLPADTKFGFAILRIQDQTAPKVFEDTGAIFSTNVAEWKRILFTLIESQRGTHSGEGEMIFWDAGNVTGNASDANSGLIYSEPKLTYNFNGANGVHDLLVDNGHSIIKGISGPGGGPITVNEYVEVDKAYNFLRCDGRDWLFEATHNEVCAVKSSAEGVEFSGFRVKSRSTGNQDAICASGDFTKIKRVQVDFSRGSGIVIDNASSCILDDFLVQDAARGGTGHAVHIVGDTSLTTRNMIKSGRIISNNAGANTDGIRVDGANCIHNFIIGSEPYGLVLHANSGWGINEVANANHTMVIGPRIHLKHNTLGTINLTGADSVAENFDQWATPADIDSVFSLSVVPYPGTYSPAFATRGGKVEYPVKTLSNFAYDFKSDISGAATIWFAMKENLKDTTYIINPKDITASIVNALLGTGLVPLTVLESSVGPKIYYGEVQTRDAGGNATASWQFKLEMIDKVMN